MAVESQENQEGNVEATQELTAQDYVSKFESGELSFEDIPENVKDEMLSADVGDPQVEPEQVEQEQQVAQQEEVTTPEPEEDSLAEIKRKLYEKSNEINTANQRQQAHEPA